MSSRCRCSQFSSNHQVAYLGLGGTAYKGPWVMWPDHVIVSPIQWDLVMWPYGPINGFGQSEKTWSCDHMGQSLMSTWCGNRWTEQMLVDVSLIYLITFLCPLDYTQMYENYNLLHYTCTCLCPCVVCISHESHRIKFLMLNQINSILKRFVVLKLNFHTKRNRIKLTKCSQIPFQINRYKTVEI